MVIDEKQTERLIRMFSRLVFLTIDRKWRFPTTYRGYAASGVSRFMTRLYPLDEEPSARIVDFVVYQVYRFREVIAEPNSRFQVTWCFSDNAIEKYRKQFIEDEGKSGITYYIDRWLSSFSIDRGRLMEIMEPPKENPMRKFIYLQCEDQARSRLHNTEAGYMLCQLRTTGWAPRSALCSSCGFAERCKADTERKYPELTRLRQQDYE